MVLFKGNYNLVPNLGLKCFIISRKPIITFLILKKILKFFKEPLSDYFCAPHKKPYGRNSTKPN